MMGRREVEQAAVFCSGDSIISFTACFGFASLQAASNGMNRSNAALVMLGPTKRPDSHCSLDPTWSLICEAVHTSRATSTIQKGQLMRFSASRPWGATVIP